MISLVGIVLVAKGIKTSKVYKKTNIARLVGDYSSLQPKEDTESYVIMTFYQVSSIPEV